MKKETVTIQIWEKGDRVLTPEGPATVMEDEQLRLTKDGDVSRMNFAYNEVRIKLDEPCSSWSSDEGIMETVNFLPLRDTP